MKENAAVSIFNVPITAETVYITVGFCASSCCCSYSVVRVVVVQKCILFDYYFRN